jgi:hypothetical protein
VSIIALEEPLVRNFVEVFARVTLQFLLARANIGHCFEVVHLEDLPCFQVLLIVKNAEESVQAGLLVRVLHTSKLILHAFALIAACLDSEHSDDVVRPWVLKN